MIENPIAESDIVIVDDNPSNLTILRDMLKTYGGHTRSVLDGRTGIVTVEKELPDLVLLDILMPDMNGLEVCRHLKDCEPTKEIPVLFISALDTIEDKNAAFAAGGADYITKPFQEQEVIARIRVHLALRNMQKCLEEKNKQLQNALDGVNTLKKFLPICASCKSIRDDKGYWRDVEIFIEQQTGFTCSHGICPDCSKKLYPEYCSDE